MLSIYICLTVFLFVCLCYDVLHHQVSEPRIGEVVPAQVKGSVEVDLSRFTGDIRQEWEALREHDVVFLVCIDQPSAEAARGSEDAKTKEEENMAEFARRYGVKYVRGGEIFEVRDEEDVVLNDPSRWVNESVSE